MLDTRLQLSLTAYALGPRPAHVVADACNPSKLHILARHAGPYSLALMSNATQELLGNCPLQVNAACQHSARLLDPGEMLAA